ncbi:MAG: ABC transporter permease [Actinobacteria bacterium]|nr:ABC transporter permease [Actinomycetota bacterium]
MADGVTIVSAGSKALRNSSAESKPESRRAVEIAWVLAKADLKQRYMGSFFGFLWTLLKPLLLFGVLYTVFTRIIGIAEGIRNYPVYLLMAFTFWGLFVEITTSSVACLVERGGILLKIKVPIFSIPLAAVIVSSVQFLATLAVFFGFLLGSGVDPQVGWLALPLIAICVGLFASAIGWILAIAYVYFRDVGPIWEVLAQVLFWATPIIYVADRFGKPLRDVLAFNPLSPLLTLSRRLIIDDTAPTLGQVYSPYALAASALVYTAVIVIGPLVFKRFAPMVTEKL